MRKYDVEKLLINEGIATEFQENIGGRFEALLEMDWNTIDEMYKTFRDVTNGVTENTVGFVRRAKASGMLPELERRCQERREARVAVLQNRADVGVIESYRAINKEVKSEVRRLKERNLEQRVDQMENDLRENNSHNLFKSV